MIRCEIEDEEIRRNGSVSKVFGQNSTRLFHHTAPRKNAAPSGPDRHTARLNKSLRYVVVFLL